MCRLCSRSTASFRTIAEIQRRFKPFLENGDDSLIPPDLQRCMYTIVSRSARWQPLRTWLTSISNPLNRPSDTEEKPSGKRSDRVSRACHLFLAELNLENHRADRRLTVYDSPPTASAKIDALMSLGATQSDELIKKTFTMLHDGSIKDQDVMYGFVSLSSNRKATRDVAKYFKENYKTVSFRGFLFETRGGLTR